MFRLLTKIGVSCPSKSRRPLAKAAADIWSRKITYVNKSSFRSKSKHDNKSLNKINISKP